MEVIHSLTAQITKRVFSSSKYGIARCQDPIKNYVEFGLEPIVVVGVCHSQLPMNYRQYNYPDQDISLTALLENFWSRSFKAPFVGMGDIIGVPDKLIIDKRLEPGLKPEFFEWLNQVGVPFEFSNTKDRQFTAKTRFVQEYPYHLCFEDFKRYRTDDDSFNEEYPITLETLNADFNRPFEHFGIEQYPKHKREILCAQYPENHTRKKFAGRAPVIDFKPSLCNLKLSNSNDEETTSLHWHYAEPEKAQFGFLRIESVEQDSIDLDDDDIDVGSTDAEDGSEKDRVDDLSLHWRQRFNEQETLLDQTMEDPRSGRPLNRWLVTLDSVEGWWGEGYVVHTGIPAFVCSWGWVTPLEAQAMASSISINAKESLAVCFTHPLSENSLFEDDQYPSLMHQAVTAVYEYLLAINSKSTQAE